MRVFRDNAAGICLGRASALLLTRLSGLRDPAVQRTAYSTRRCLFRIRRSSRARKRRLQPVTQADLVDASGNCAGAAPAVANAKEMQLLRHRAASRWQMTECEVVRPLGPPASVEIGANERGDRTRHHDLSGGRPADLSLYQWSSDVDRARRRAAAGAVKKKPPPKRQAGRRPESRSVQSAIASS